MNLNWFYNFMLRQHNFWKYLIIRLLFLQAIYRTRTQNIALFILWNISDVYLTMLSNQLCQIRFFFYRDSTELNFLIILSKYLFSVFHFVRSSIAEKKAFSSFEFKAAKTLNAILKQILYVRTTIWGETPQTPLSVFVREKPP